jgi:hypothetical protein
VKAPSGRPFAGRAFRRVRARAIGLHGHPSLQRRGCNPAICRNAAEAYLALEFDSTADLRGSKRQITHPERLEVGRDIEIDLKSGIWDFRNTGRAGGRAAPKRGISSCNRTQIGGC